MLYTEAASPDTQMFLGNAQHLWGEAGPAALLDQGPGGLPRTLANALALPGPWFLPFLGW